MRQTCSCVFIDNIVVNLLFVLFTLFLLEATLHLQQPLSLDLYHLMVNRICLVCLIPSVYLSTC
ncbi:hypothetical protein IW262DRAFT_1343156 [Armillaria fumosa]|nr:hypothetical protein IW262DRAFT_1343156 [Armillaria fumosa]